MTDLHWRAIICNHVFDTSRAVSFVVHSSDDEWMLLCGDEHPAHKDQYKVAGIGHLLNQDPSLNEVLDLAAGQSAERAFPGGPWARLAYIEEQDGAS